MRYFVHIIFLLFTSILVFAQEKKIQFYRYNDETKSYTKDFESKNLDSSLDSLQKNGYYTLTIDSIKNEKIYLNKGKNYQTIWVKNNDLFENKNDYFPTNNLDSILNKLAKTNINEGYPFAQIKLVPNGFQQREATNN